MGHLDVPCWGANGLPPARPGTPPTAQMRRWVDPLIGSPPCGALAASLGPLWVWNAGMKPLTGLALPDNVPDDLERPQAPTPLGYVGAGRLPHACTSARRAEDTCPWPSADFPARSPAFDYALPEAPPGTGLGPSGSCRWTSGMHGLASPLPSLACSSRQCTAPCY